MVLEHLDHVMNLLAEEIAEAVHHIDRSGRGLGKLVQRLDKVKLILTRDGHNVDTGFIPQVMHPVAQGDRLVNILDIGGNADHIHRALVDGTELLLEHAVGIDHDADLHIGFNALDDLADLVVVAILPRSEFSRRRNLAAGTIAHFHIIHTRNADRLVNGPDKFVSEIMVINQSAVANRAIQYLDFFSVHNLSNSLIARFNHPIKAAFNDLTRHVVGPLAVFAKRRAK